MKKQRASKIAKASAPVARRKRIHRHKTPNSTGIFIAAVAGVTTVILLLLALSGEPQSQSPRKKRLATDKTREQSTDNNVSDLDKATTGNDVSPKRQGKSDGQATALTKTTESADNKNQVQIPDQALSQPKENATGLALYRNLSGQSPDDSGSTSRPKSTAVSEDKKTNDNLEKTKQAGTLARYRSQLQAAKESVDVERFLRLADWCREHIPEKTAEVYRQVLDIWPNNSTARKALGFFQIGSDWFENAEDARRLGYHQYQGQWYTAKQLKRRGLIYHESQWLTKTAIKEKGLLGNDDKKGSGYSIYKPHEAKSKKTPKAKSRGVTKTEKSKKTIRHRAIMITTPLAYWQNDSPSVFPKSITDLPKI